MARNRPKLLVLGGPSIDADSVAAALSPLFEIIVGSPVTASDALESGECEAVIADARDYRALEGEFESRRASLLLNAVAEGLSLYDAEGNLVWANRRFLSMDDEVRRRVGRLCRHAAAAFRVVASPVEEASDEDAFEASTPVRRCGIALSASRRYFEVLLSPVVARAGGAAVLDHRTGGGRDAVDRAEKPPPMPGGGPPDPAITHVAVVVRDVTMRRRMQQKINALHQAGRELMNLDAESLRKLNAAERLAMLESRVVRLAHDLLHFDNFTIRLTNKATNTLDLVMSRGLPSEATSIVLKAEPEGQGISGYVAATGQSYICRDATRDRRYVMGLHQCRSSLTVPLRLFDQVIGIFNVESERVGAFTKTDEQFAEIFATYLAMALHMLNLLLVERVTTSQVATGTVQGELSGPLNDLLMECQWLREHAPDKDSEASRHVDRLAREVEIIRSRLRNLARGPQRLLGVEDAIAKREIDPVLEGRRILVADNEPQITETIRDVLRHRGAIVVDCQDGGSAVKLLEQWKASHDATEAFDLVVSDINLGDFTGYDIFAAAKRADPNIPVILMTGFGYDPHHSIVRASQEGLQCVLFKPFQAEKLVEEVKNALMSRK